MAKRNPAKEFRTLLGLLRRTPWPIRRIEDREVVQAGRLGVSAAAGFADGRAWFSARLEGRRFRKLMADLGYEGYFAPWYRRLCPPTLRAVDRERELLREALGGGEVAPRKAIPWSAPKPWSNTRGQAGCRALIERVERSGRTPPLLFLRHEARVRRFGLAWRVTCDGYWEPSCRKGLEIDLLLTTDGGVSPRQWKGLSGFLKTLPAKAREVRCRPELRPRLGVDDFDGTSGAPLLATFARTFRKLDGIRREVEALLRWSPF